MSKKGVSSLEAALAGSMPAARTDEISGDGPITTTQSAPKAKNYEQVVAYIPTAAKKRLRLMCIEHDRDLNSFIREGIDLMLAKHGQPSLKEFEKKQ